MPIYVHMLDHYAGDDNCDASFNFEDEKDLESFIKLNPQYSPVMIDWRELSEEEKERYEKIGKGLGY